MLSWSPLELRFHHQTRIISHHGTLLPTEVRCHSIILEEIPQLSLQGQRMSKDERVEQRFVPENGAHEVSVTSRCVRVSYTKSYSGRSGSLLWKTRGLKALSTPLCILAHAFLTQCLFGMFLHGDSFPGLSRACVSLK